MGNAGINYHDRYTLLFLFESHQNYNREIFSGSMVYRSINE